MKRACIPFTSSDSQLINGSSLICICSAGKRCNGLIHLKVSCKWGKLLQSKKSNFQPSKMRLTYIKTSLQKLHPLRAAGGTARGAGPGSPHAGAPPREETNYLFFGSSLSFPRESHLYLPHLRIHRKHLSSLCFLIWVYFLGHEFLFPNIFGDFYFYYQQQVFDTMHLSRQFSFKLPVKDRNLSIASPASRDSHSLALLIPSFQIPGNIFLLVPHLGNSAVSSLFSPAGMVCEGHRRQKQRCLCPCSSSCRIP